MNTININSIIIPEDRQRRQVSPAVPDLVSSIQEHGLFHALVLRPDAQTLVAGHTRYTALKTLPEGFVIHYDGKALPPNHVPYTVSESDDPIAIFEIELHENICRADLHWADRAEAVARLDELRRSQHGDYDPIKNPKGWSTSKTAGEINKDTPSGNKGGFITKVKEDIALAQAIAANPELAKIKDRRKAIKAVKQIEKRVQRSEAFEAPGTNTAPIVYKIANCLDFVASLPDASIDIVLSDPPYGRNFHLSKLWSGQVREFNDSPEAYQALMTELIPLLAIKMKDQAHLYFFCDLFHFEFLAMHLEFAGITPWRYPIIWDKDNMGSYANIEYGPRHVYDTIIYGNKGQKPIVTHCHDIIRGISPLMDKIHPDEKPPQLLDEILRRSAQPNDVVLDPFGGSGSIIPVTYWNNCQLYLCEEDSQWEPTIQRRIAETEE